jgi:hypothetical protein
MLKQGGGSLTNAELLALIIRTGDTATKKAPLIWAVRLSLTSATTCVNWELPTLRKSARSKAWDRLTIYNILLNPSVSEFVEICS